MALIDWLKGLIGGSLALLGVLYVSQSADPHLGLTAVACVVSVGLIWSVITDRRALAKEQD